MKALVKSAVLVAFVAPFTAVPACGSDVVSPQSGDGGTPHGIPIGDPCLPTQEQRKNFAGYELTEVSVESGGATCSPGVCLIAHFQGRVSCPYGQADNGMVDPTTGIAEIDPALSFDQRCYLAATRQDPANQIVVPVRPQYVSRPPEQAVYCSCRCDGPNPKGSYCDCPTGYVCEPLVSSGGDPYQGSYCIKKGSELDDPTSLINSPLCNSAMPSPRPIGCGTNRHPGGL